MMDLLYAMTYVLASWLALGLLLVGLGLGVARLYGMRRVDADRVCVAFWVGLAVTVTAALAWHFLARLSGWTLLVLAALSVAGLAGSAAELGAWLGRSLRRHPGAALVGCGVVAWLADRAIGPGQAYDSGLYHLLVMRWGALSPLPPGLANLYFAHALNPSSPLYAALLEGSCWAGRSGHIANGLLLAMLAVQGLIAATRLLHGGRATWAQDVFALVLLLPAMSIATDHQAFAIASPTTDVPTNLTLFMATGGLLALLARADADPLAQSYRAVTAGWLLTLVVAFKLTMSVYALAGWLVALGWWTWHARRQDAALRWKPLRWAAGGSALLVGLWLVRGYVLSGYPLFPARVGRLNLPWTMPDRQYQDMVGMMQAFARDPRHLGSITRYWDLPLWLTAGALGLAALLALVRWRRPALPAALGWMLVPLAAGLGFWATCLLMRHYAFPLFWVGAALSTVLLLALAPGWSGRALPAGVVGLVALAALLFPVDLPPLYTRLRHRPDLLGTFLAHVYLVPPGSDHGFHPTPTAPMRVFTTRWGLDVNVPATGDQCWEAALPCTPWPNPDLRLRRPGDLGSGFVVDCSSAPGAPR